MVHISGDAEVKLAGLLGYYNKPNVPGDMPHRRRPSRPPVGGVPRTSEGGAETQKKTIQASRGGRAEDF